MYSTQQAADVLGLSVKTVAQHCRSGLIRAVKAGRDWRIPEAEIERYQRERRPPGRPRAKENP